MSKKDTFSLDNFRKIKGFTIVELIVVVTVVIILWTIAFLEFWSFVGSARDTARTSDMDNIKTVLDLHQINSGSYPMPEDYLTVVYSGNILSYQWAIGKNLSSVLHLSSSLKDPKTGIYYPYALNESGTQYQLGTYLEWLPQVISFLPYNVTFADNIYPYALGDNVGLLFTGANLIPLNETMSGTLEAATFTWVLTTLIGSNATVTTSGSKLPFFKTIQNKKIRSLLKQDIVNGTLRWSWDMETRAGNTLLDISAYGGISTSVWDKTIGDSTGHIGQGTYFNGNSPTESIIIHDLDENTDFNFTKAITIEGWINWWGDNGETTGDGNTEQAILCAGEWDKSLRIAESGFSGHENRLIGNFGTIGEFFSSGSITPNVWTHIGLTYDGTEVVFYINGVKDSAFIASGDMNPVSSMVTIGGEIDGNPFKGILDDLRVYSRALSENEMWKTYCATEGGDCNIIPSVIVPTPPPPVVNHTWTTCNGADEILVGAGADEQCWKDRNVWAASAGTGFANAGVFFQWGRNDILPTGMWFLTGTTTTRHSAVGNIVGNNLFIKTFENWKAPVYFDDDLWWGSGTTAGTGTFHSSDSTAQIKMQWPCPVSFHVPTYVELNTAITSAGGYVGFYSLLKTAFGWYKRYTDGKYGDNNSFTNPASGWSARFWTSTPNNTGDTYYLYIDTKVYETWLPGSSAIWSDYRAQGLNVRCIKD